MNSVQCEKHATEEEDLRRTAQEEVRRTEHAGTRSGGRIPRCAFSPANPDHNLAVSCKDTRPKSWGGSNYGSNCMCVYVYVAVAQRKVSLSRED
eukprot:2891500-Rhodomonas_salina.2